MKWIRVWLHCLINTFYPKINGNHRMCMSILSYHGKSSNEHYCSCGYMQSPFIKTVEDIERKLMRRE